MFNIREAFHDATVMLDRSLNAVKDVGVKVVRAVASSAEFVAGLVEAVSDISSLKIPTSIKTSLHTILEATGAAAIGKALMPQPARTQPQLVTINNNNFNFG